MTIKFSLLFLIIFTTSMAQAQVLNLRSMSGHLPFKAMARARHLGRYHSQQIMNIAISLKQKNEDELAALIEKLHDPADPLYGKFLKPEEFHQKFSPSDEEVQTVVNYLQAQGLRIKSVSPNLIQVQGYSQQIENTFQIELHSFLTSDQREVFAPASEPMVPEYLGDLVQNIVGLDNFAVRRSHILHPNANPTGSGPGGGLSPSDIRKAYGLSYPNLTGAGQTLAVIELDGYKASDIATYAGNFGISNPPTLQNVLVDGFNGQAGTNADEVTLDIELMVAVSPGASKILVYEGDGTEAGWLDIWKKIANDNLASVVSDSWGSSEDSLSQSLLNSENTIFMQMAAQGQSIFAAAGDAGAFDNGSSLSVDDPASQPYVVAVGGTTLTTASGVYKSESSWGVSGKDQQGGGGGISGTWSLPSFQSSLATAANLGSSANRMVPDVSLDANPNSGYAIYYNGSWQVYGGTSCAAPLWAAFMSLVNQQRALSGISPIGYPNPLIYTLGRSSQYGMLFHDIGDASTNLHYPAVTGFDLSTGWGSMNGANLIYHLAPPPAPTGLRLGATP